MTRRHCDVCGQPLPATPPGRRGRPASRHPECQAQHRRDYLRAAQYRHRMALRRRQTGQHPPPTEATP